MATAKTTTAEPETKAKKPPKPKLDKVNLPLSLSQQLFAAIKETIQAGKELHIEGVGVFKPKDLPERQARNPNTGDEVTAPAVRKLAFSPDRRLNKSFTLPGTEAEPTAPASAIAASAPTAPPSAPPSAPPTAPPSAPPSAPPKIWFMQDSTPAGYSEVPQNMLIEKGMTPSTMVWSAETDWKQASSIPDLAALLQPVAVK